MIGSYARSRYQEMQVQTTGGKLVVMIYDGALRFLNLALDAMDRGDTKAQGEYLGKAQSVLVQLLATLNFEAGSIAYELYAIYRYCIERLMVANITDDRAPIEEVRERLEELREAWEFADRNASIAAAGSVYVAERPS